MKNVYSIYIDVFTSHKTKKSTCGYIVYYGEKEISKSVEVKDDCKHVQGNLRALFNALEDIVVHNGNESGPMDLNIFVTEQSSVKFTNNIEASIRAITSKHDKLMVAYPDWSHTEMRERIRSDISRNQSYVEEKLLVGESLFELVKCGCNLSIYLWTEKSTHSIIGQIRSLMAQEWNRINSKSKAVASMRIASGFHSNALH